MQKALFLSVLAVLSVSFAGRSGGSFGGRSSARPSVSRSSSFSRPAPRFTFTAPAPRPRVTLTKPAPRPNPVIVLHGPVIVPAPSRSVHVYHAPQTVYVQPAPTPIYTQAPARLPANWFGRVLGWLALLLLFVGCVWLVGQLWWRRR